MDPQSTPITTNQTLPTNPNQNQGTVNAPQTPPQKKNNVKIIALCLLIVLFIALGVFLVIKPMPAKTVQHSQTSIPTITSIPVTKSVSADIASVGTMFAADKERSGMYPGKGIDTTPTLLWKFTTDHKPNPIDFQDSAIRSTPVAAEGKVFLATIIGDIYAIDGKTDQKIWKASVSGTLNYSSPAYADGKLYIGSDFGGLNVFDTKTGKLLWKFDPVKKTIKYNNATYTDTRFTVNSSPVVIDGKVIIGTQDGVYIVDAQSGNQLLHIADAKGSTVAVNQNMIFLNGQFGEIQANDLITGKTIWSKNINKGTIFSYPVVSGNTVLVGNNVGSLFAFDAATGQDKWSYTPCIDNTCIGLAGTPAVDGTTAYISWGKGNVSAVDLATGKEKWNMHIATRPLYPPIINNDTVYVTTLNHEVKPNDNHVLGLYAKSGQVKWDYPIPPLANGYGNSILNSPSLYDGVLYFGTDGGILYALH